jgi:two-component system phosphate regulon response regulator OmpR
MPTPKPPSILVVDDEPKLRRMLQDYLNLHGFAVRQAGGGAELDERLAEAPADLLILDVNMPDEGGFAIARRLRASGSRVGILMLTAAGDLEHRLEGLGGGADDYLAKPVELRELLARARSVLRRVEAEAAVAPPPRRRCRFGRCTLDLDARQMVDEAGAEVPLTAMEYDLLATFAAHPREVLSRERLASLAHDRPLEPGDRSIDIRITRLRQRIEPDPANPATIRTVRGAGYVFEPWA